NPLPAVPDRLQVAPKKPAQPPAPSEQSADFKRLVELRAYMIWIRRGRPMGPAGDAVKEENWLEAERQITREVKARADVMWDQQGRPSGPAGEAVCEKNMRTAAAALLKETEEELRRHPVD
ncbi:MAG TPA: DUF2934 domain-containing protein, partial [Isosphaeraceae bacterium]|nr:DUF2934 domain-containing protein [Isosphaeraceae bacterium]